VLRLLRGNLDPLGRAAGAPPGLSVGLTAYWKLDEASNLTRVDSTPTGANLTQVINSNVAQDPSGKINAGALFAFGGTNGYLRSQSAALSLSNLGIGNWTRSWTWSFWFKTTNNANNMVLLSHGGANGAAISKGAGNTTQLTVTIGNSSFAATVGTTNNGLWHLVVWGFDAATGKAYIRFDNGAEIQNSGGVSVNYDDGDFRLGTSVGFAATSSRFGGSIDEVGLWASRKLAAADCSALWNAGAGQGYPFP
jgi:hypothetical protein